MSRFTTMTDKMDKSLDDLIAEQRSKGSKKPDHGAKAAAGGRPRSSRAAPSASRSKQAARPDNRRDGRKQDAAGPPPRDPAYYMVRGPTQHQQHGCPLQAAAPSSLPQPMPASSALAAAA